ncbi:NAD(P)H-binding protein [Microlunatus soli]|nr:NAD(P)H-binding protein [Microlunatus soli]
MILITGATGTVGHHVLELLSTDPLRREPLRAISRQPDRISVAGVDAVAADLDDPPTLAAATEGVRAVFLATAPGPTIPDHDLALITAAVRAGVTKIVKLSAIGTTPESDQPDLGSHAPAGWHAPGERALAGADTLRWVSLRPASFASNALSWADDIRAGRPVINTTGNGAMPVIDPADIAAVAVRALLDDRLDGTALTLTGPAPISVPEQVAVLADLLGRRIPVTDLTSEESRRHYLDQGWPTAVAEEIVGSQLAVREGRHARPTAAVAEVLGRPGADFAGWAARNRSAFTG